MATTETCSVVGCGNTVKTRKMCPSHYQRYYRLQKEGLTGAKLAARFYSDGRASHAKGFPPELAAHQRAR